MKPILKYPGAKWRLAEWIIEHMPDHESYLEPFFGSGAILFNKSRARVETVNDIDGEIVQFFKTCRNHPEDLAKAISLTPWAREEFQNCDFIDDAESLDDVERARQFLVRIWMTFGARTRCKTGWRHSTSKTPGGGPDNPKLWRRLPDIICEVADRLMDVQIDNRPALETIKRFDGPEVLIYADPPYLKQTRTLNGDQYRHEMTDTDHEELLSALIDFKGMVLLSGYDCEMYRDLLPDWQMVTKDTVAERGAKRTECLWINPLALERRGMLGWEMEQRKHTKEAT